MGRMHYRVNAVIVTHDRVDLLKQSVEGMLRQSYELNKIIIVDNASTDGTRAYLRSIKKNPKLDLVLLKKNVGSAGGFFYGIQRAYALGCDHIWTMDDDAVAKADALEKLMSSMETLKDKKIGFLASNVLFRDGSPCRMNVSRTVRCWNEFISNGIVEISHTSFVGMLIPAKVVREVGLPIREYFIWGDDAEYSTRILRAGYSGYQIGNSTIVHYESENLGVDIFNAPQERISRFFYFYRNVTTTDRMKGAVPLLLRIGYHGFIILKILFGRTDHRLRKSLLVLLGTVCGVFHKVKIEYVQP